MDCITCVFEVCTYVALVTEVSPTDAIEFFNCQGINRTLFRRKRLVDLLRLGGDTL